MTIERLAVPSFMGGLVGNPSLFVVALGIPAVIVLLLTFLSNGFNFSGPTPVNYGAFIPYLAIQIIFTLAFAWGILSLVLSMRKYWVSLNENSPVETSGPRQGFVGSFIAALVEILPHTTFKDCEANRIRFVAHFLTFWGMIGLVITTAIVAFNIDILHLKPPSQGGPGTVPLKILGNVSAGAFVLGLLIMLVRRVTSPEQAGNSSYFDWFFLLVIVGTGATGVLTEVVRASGSVPGAYFLYMIHLMFILTLFLYVPYSKFAHMGYRAIAIAWGKSVGRNMTIPTKPNV